MRTAAFPQESRSPTSNRYISVAAWFRGGSAFGLMWGCRDVHETVSRQTSPCSIRLLACFRPHRSADGERAHRARGSANTTVQGSSNWPPAVRRCSMDEGYEIFATLKFDLSDEDLGVSSRSSRSRNLTPSIRRHGGSSLETWSGGKPHHAPRGCRSVCRLRCSRISPRTFRRD
jgi:hypothetical protein